MRKPCVILSVDDNDDDHFLLRRAFARGAGDALSLQIVNDGQEAIDCLDRLLKAEETEGAEGPDLVLLDLKMPRRDGFAVLKWIREQPALGRLPVAVFTSSQRRDDIDNAYRCGATCYLVKPIALEELIRFAAAVAEWMETGDASHVTGCACYRSPRDPVDPVA